MSKTISLLSLTAAQKIWFSSLPVCHPMIDGEARRDQHSPQQGPPASTCHRAGGRDFVLFSVILCG